MPKNKPNLKNQTNLGLRTVDIVAAYTLVRIVTGINYFNHGATRILNWLTTRGKMVIYAGAGALDTH